MILLALAAWRSMVDVSTEPSFQWTISSISLNIS